MKKSIKIAALAFAVLLASCQKPESVKISNLSTTELTFKENETSSSISFTTNRPWTASVDASWVKIDPISGKEGNNVINVDVNKSELQERSATITISCMDVKETVSVKQNQKDQMILNDHKKEVPGEAGSFSVTLNTNVNYSVSIPVDWLKLESTKAYEKKTVTFSYKDNTTYENREANIVFKSSNGKFIDTLLVKQATLNALILGEKTKDISCTEQTLNVELKYNVEHTVSITESWIHNNPRTSANGLSAKTYSFSIDANNMESERVGKIIFTSKDRTLADTLTITQAKQMPSLSIGGPSEYSFSSDGGSFKIAVNANIDYTTDISESWVTKKSGNEFTVAANGTTDARQAKITFKGTTHPELSATVTIKQAQNDQINLKETSKTLGSAAGSFSITVGANVDYSIKISADWLKQVNSKAYVSEELTFSYEGNETYDDRTAKVTFTSADGKITKEFTATQSAKGGLILGEKTKTVSCPAQNVFVTLQYNVDHNISISENWIHKTSASSTNGLDTKTYSFSLDANTATVERTGKIIFTSKDGTLADTLVITQEKFVPVLEISGQTEYELGSQSSKITITVTSNIDYSSIIGDKWVTKKSASEYSIAENTGTEARQTSIIFKGKDYPEMVATVTIKQAQKDQINLGETSKNVGSAAGTFKLEVGSNLEYNVSSSADWLKQVESKAYVTDELTFSYESNETYDDRTAKITFASKDGKISKDFTLTQSAKGGLILGEKTKTVSFEQQEVSVTLQYNVKYTLSIADSWIHSTTTQATNGLSSKTFTFALDPNYSSSERIGKIVFTSEDKTLSDTVVITQEAFSGNVLTFTYSTQTVTVPAVTGDNGLRGIIEWGDGTTEEYQAGKSHTYSTTTSHTVTLLLFNNKTVTFNSIKGLSSFDISKF